MFIHSILCKRCEIKKDAPVLYKERLCPSILSFVYRETGAADFSFVIFNFKPSEDVFQSDKV